MLTQNLINGTCWCDTTGDPIHAHGGHIVNFGGTYYWYGENRLDGRYVSCYTSTDLLNWEFRNDILTVSSATEDIGLEGDTLLMRDGVKVNIERPKVVYNEKTGKYVMWAHYENGIDYSEAAIALATCDTPDGDFTYHGYFRPFGCMSRDCNVFEKDGKMYFASASNDNRDMHIYLMNDDYMGVEKQVNKLFIGQYREAPAFFEDNGTVYMLSSSCTGWSPNQGGWSCSDSMGGEWKPIAPIGDETTYRTQPTAVLTLKTNGKTQYVYIGDRWGGNDWNIVDGSGFDYHKSCYYFSLIEIGEDGTLALRKCSEFTIDLDGSGFVILA